MLGTLPTQTGKAEAIVDGDRSDKFLRAETAFERRLYRALGVLVAIKQAQSLPPSIPANTKSTENLPPDTENKPST